MIAQMDLDSIRGRGSVSEANRSLSPESRRWTFAVVCELCGAVPSCEVFNLASTAYLALELLRIVSPAMRVPALVGLVTHSISKLLTGSQRGDAEASLSPLARVPVALGEWAAYTSLMGLAF